MNKAPSIRRHFGFHRRQTRMRCFPSLMLVVIMLFCASSVLAQTVTWTGTGDWFTDTVNWAGGIPGPGSNVVISSGSVILTNNSPILSTLTIANGATLVSSNWTTTLTASNVLVQTNGTLTLPAAFTTAMMSNRIYVICTNFTVDQGGKVLADSRGFSSYNGPGKGTAGPGNNSGGGAGYGGKGGDGFVAGGDAVGSTNAPMEPGSGGGYGSNDAAGRPGGKGGGLVQIEASGAVTIKGRVTANGGDGGGTTYTGGGGSGGAINIVCTAFDGTETGLLQANGGNAIGTTYLGGGGGGGRISVDYTSLVGGDAAVGFETKGGTGRAGGYMGTLYLSNTDLLSTTLERFNNIRVVIPGFTSWTIPIMTISNRVVALEPFEGGSLNLAVAGNLTITNGGLNMGGMARSKGVSDNISGAAANPSLTVGGDLRLTGGGSLTLGISGDGSPVRLTVTNDVWVEGSGSGIYAGGTRQIPPTLLTVKGALTLTNSAVLWVYSGVTNSSTPTGALMAVAGSLTVRTTAWIYPVSQATNGGSVWIMATNLTLDSGGGINANSRGYQNAFGPGKGGNGGVGFSGGGGGYGGNGGSGSGGASGSLYGSTNMPVTPGSGGGNNNNAVANIGGLGGGAVLMKIAGAATVNGTITANGGDGTGSITFGGGGGSGGAITLICASYGGSSGILRAIGGNGQGTTVGGGGGGGRISVITGFSDSQLADLAADTSGPEVVFSSNENSYAGWTLSVTNGSGRTTPVPAGAGTVRYFSIQSASEKTVTISAQPDQYGSPSPNAYGDHIINLDTVFTNTVVTPANPSATQRWACTGWNLYDDQSALLASGTTAQAVFTVTTNLTLQWKWTNEYYLTVNAGPQGSVTGSGWFTNSVLAPITASSTNGAYAFLQWNGDIPAAQRYSASTSLLMDKARLVTAAFPSLAGESKTWSSGVNDWGSPANWSPAGMPGNNDTVLIAGGSVLLSTPQTVAALTITNATMVFTNWTTALTATTITVGKQGTLTLPSAGFTSSMMSNRIHVVCADFTLGTNGTILADARGYSSDSGTGRGSLGAVNSSSGGGGYGGQGGAGLPQGGGFNLGGSPYGSTNMPLDPGSGGGVANGGFGNVYGGTGGGAVLLEASRSMTIYGTITAGGGTGVGAAYAAGGGSGGAITILCNSLSGNGILRANGGDSGAYTVFQGGGGGGGRIAVWVKVEESMRNQYLAGNTNRVLRATTHVDFTGTPSVTNGIGRTASPAEPGTAYFFTGPPSGTIFLMR